MPRMNILNTVEREAFDSPPMFNGGVRKRYFDFPAGLRRLAGNLRTPIHRLGFLLSAYFIRASRAKLALIVGNKSHSYFTAALRLQYWILENHPISRLIDREAKL